jgi:hypothetical protein
MDYKYVQPCLIFFFPSLLPPSLLPSFRLSFLLSLSLSPPSLLPSLPLSLPFLSLGRGLSILPRLILHGCLLSDYGRLSLSVFQCLSVTFWVSESTHHLCIAVFPSMCLWSLSLHLSASLSCPSLCLCLGCVCLSGVVSYRMPMGSGRGLEWKQARIPRLKRPLFT